MAVTHGSSLGVCPKEVAYAAADYKDPCTSPLLDVSRHDCIIVVKVAGHSRHVMAL